jgi:tetratricopeptide (TPR) repeat protein
VTAAGTGLTELLLGQIALDEGEAEEAVLHLLGAREAFEFEGDRVQAARAQAHLASAYRLAGQHAKAREAREQAARVLEELGIPVVFSWE